MVTQIGRELAALLADQRVELSISRVGGPFMGRAGDATVRRMVGRLLTALVDVSEPEATLVGQLVTESRPDAMLQPRIVRPAAIRLGTAAALLYPGFRPAGAAHSRAPIGRRPV